MEKIVHIKFTMQLLEENFITLRVKEGQTIEVEDIREVYAGYEKLVGQNDYVVAVYGSPLSSMSKKASELAAKEYASDKRKKVAVISENIANVFIVKLYILLNKPKTNIKIFKKEALAFEWLREV